MTIPGAIYNSTGKVAMRYGQPIQKLLQLGNKHSYIFVPRFSVSLAWVDEEDVGIILAVPPKRKCCGGGKSSGFTLANQASINCWTNGGR
jgi:hypothetical protein